MPVTAASIAVTIRCDLCGGPFTVNVPMRTDGATVYVDTDSLRAAVRVHHRQHEN